MLIRCWGARGSIPVSGREFLRYGGDTPCMEVRPDDGQVVIIDAGSGIRALGNRLIREQRKEVTLILSHAHWDHLMGFPFFKPIYHRDSRITIYGCPFSHPSLQWIVSRTMEAPLFPVSFDRVEAAIDYRNIPGERFTIGSLTVEILPLSHPNRGIGLKLTENGRTFVFLTDNELTCRHAGGMDWADYRKFSRGADLLIHDAEFIPQDYPRRIGWGHSVFSDALKLAMEAEVARFGLYHHHQERDDDALDAMVAECRHIQGVSGSTMESFAVAQGMEIDL